LRIEYPNRGPDGLCPGRAPQTVVPVKMSQELSLFRTRKLIRGAPGIHVSTASISSHCPAITGSTSKKWKSEKLFLFDRNLSPFHFLPR
jgi:hypothetical protein